MIVRTALKEETSRPRISPYPTIILVLMDCKVQPWMGYLLVRCDGSKSTGIYRADRLAGQRGIPARRRDQTACGNRMTSSSCGVEEAPGQYAATCHAFSTHSHSEA